MVSLELMTEEELVQFFPVLWQNYKETLMENGMSESMAEANIEMNKKSLWPEGKLRDGNFLFNVVSNQQRVGHLWIAKQANDLQTFFIYDIEIGETFRGKGFGRETMLAAEEFSRSQGATHLELNVFWKNDVAKGLYQSLGFNFTSAHMQKKL
jgi:ribosomal protein S18 acetylase RimI-like enzyme